MNRLAYLAACALLLACLSGMAQRNLAAIVPRLPQEGVAKNLPPTVAEAVAKLYSPDAREQGRALHALAAMGAEAAPAVPYAVFLCGAPHPVEGGNRRDTTLGAVVQLFLDAVGKTAPDAILKEMGDAQAPHFVPCLRALAGSADPAAARRVVELLGHPDAKVRQTAVESALPLFGREGQEDVAARFSAILQGDQSTAVREAVLGVVGLAPFEPGDARDELVRIAWRDPSPLIRAATLAKFSGTPSKEFFLAVLESLDKDCCGATDCTLFLENCVQRMRPVLAELLAGEDRDQRQKAHLLLYYYDPDPDEDTVKRLFADPSPDLLLAVLRHVVGPRHVFEAHAGTGLLLHGGMRAESGDSAPPNLGMLPLREPPVAALLMRHGLRSGNPEIAQILLQAKWRKFPVEDDMILAALKPKDTRLHVLDRLPPDRLTAEHLLLVLDTDDPGELRVAFQKLGSSRQQDRRLVERSIELATTHRDFARVAYRSALANRMPHFPLFQERVLNGKDDELRRVGYEVLGDLPRIPAVVDALQAAREHPDPAVRQAAARTATVAEETPVDPDRLREQLDQAVARAIADGRPEEVVAALGAAWNQKIRRIYADPTVPAEAFPLLVAALGHPDPSVSDKGVLLLARGRCRAAAGEVVAYLTEHHPRVHAMSEATHLGAAAVEPLAALALSHGSPDVRRRAMEALSLALVSQGEPYEEIRNAPVTRRALVKIMLDASDITCRSHAIAGARKVLPEETCRRIYEMLRKEGNPALDGIISKALMPDTAGGVLPPEATPAGIAELARSPSWIQRQQATAWSARVDWDETVRSAMLELARDRDWRVCESAMVQLGRHLADEAACREVAALLMSDETENQLLGLRIFTHARSKHECRSEDVALLSLVRALATSENSQVRLAVVHALPRPLSGSDETILRRLAYDSNRMVAQEAGDTVRRLAR